jgi:hypothetical protein
MTTSQESLPPLNRKKQTEKPEEKNQGQTEKSYGEIARVIIKMVAESLPPPDEKELSLFNLLEAAAGWLGLPSRIRGPGGSRIRREVLERKGLCPTEH